MMNLAWIHWRANDCKITLSIYFAVNKNCLHSDWSSSRVFIPTFWPARVLDTNVMTRPEYSIEYQSRDSARYRPRAGSGSGFPTRPAKQSKIQGPTTDRSFPSRFRAHGPWRYWLLLIGISRAEFTVLLIMQQSNAID